MRTGEMVWTVGEKRLLMPLDYYRSLSEFIISQLEVRSTVPLFELVDQVHAEFQSIFRGDLSWHILSVKKDLEARKIIRVVRGQDRKQSIRLRKKYKQRMATICLEVRGIDGPRLEYYYNS